MPRPLASAISRAAALAHLAHAAGRRLEVPGRYTVWIESTTSVARLERRHVRLDRLELVSRPRSEEPDAATPEPVGPQLHLRGRLLARDVEHRRPPLAPARLEAWSSRVRLADARDRRRSAPASPARRRRPARGPARRCPSESGRPPRPTPRPGARAPSRAPRRGSPARAGRSHRPPRRTAPVRSSTIVLNSPQSGQRPYHLPGLEAARLTAVDRHGSHGRGVPPPGVGAAPGAGVPRPIAARIRARSSTLRWAPSRNAARFS